MLHPNTGKAVMNIQEFKVFNNSDRWDYIYVKLDADSNQQSAISNQHPTTGLHCPNIIIIID